MASRRGVTFLSTQGNRTDPKNGEYASVKFTKDMLKFTSLKPEPKSNEKGLFEKNSTTPLTASNLRNAKSDGFSKISNKLIDGKAYKNLDKVISDINFSLGIPNPEDTVTREIRRATRYYNRYKVPNPNTYLNKGFPHVFFVRPNCNIYINNKLTDSLKRKESFQYANEASRELLQQLCSPSQVKTDNDFMLYLSNAAASFSLSDEYINTDTYGKTYTGYKVAYGKNDIESKTSGEFTVTYNDDRYFHLYQLNRCWVEYISGVYRGEIDPDPMTIKHKEIDYAGAVYYIITAEDGETIIFWSKYFGVFPSQIPSDQYSWGEGNVLNNPQLSIRYQYSWKRDYNPYDLLCFNSNSSVKDERGINEYIDNLPWNEFALAKWQGCPFIETVRNTNGEDDVKYGFKLRFTEPLLNRNG